MDENNDEARLGLDLGLGLNEYKPDKRDKTPQTKNKKRAFFLDLSIPVHMSDTDRRHAGTGDDSSSSLKIMGKDVVKQGIIRQNNNGFSVSGGKEEGDDDESKMSMDFSSCRKKLRLTRDQTALLEDSFKLQTTLNTAQKQALAEKLNLKPRQVEVWFQNRRARTKLKQTEVDCEFLKKNCERLSEENWRLKKELLELRSSMKIEKPPPPPAAGPQFLNHNHKAAAAHEKNGKNRGGGEKKDGAAMEVVHNRP